VICNTDRWTPLSHNSTCALIPRWRDSRCECQFCPTFWLSEPFFLAGWFWSALNWNRSRCRYRKGLAFHRRSRPRKMISRPRLGLNAISPSSLKRRSFISNRRVPRQRNDARPAISIAARHCCRTGQGKCSSGWTRSWSSIFLKQVFRNRRARRCCNRTLGTHTPGLLPFSRAP